MFEGFAVLIAFYMAGELLSTFLGIPVPGNVIGLILVVLCLQTGLVEIERVERAASLLIDNLMFLFVPAGVGIMLHFDLVAGSALLLVVMVVASTLAVLGVVGLVVQHLERRGSEQGVSEDA